MSEKAEPAIYYNGSDLTLRLLVPIHNHKVDIASDMEFLMGGTRGGLVGL